jgi:hypothetical protein
VFQHACYRCQHACYTPNFQTSTSMLQLSKCMLQMCRWQRRCGGQGRRPMAASINTSLFAPSKKITPRPPRSPSLGFLHHKRLGRTLRGRALPTATSSACPAWQRVPRVAGERRAALHPRELPGGLRRKQHDADTARPRSAAAPVSILQPCGGAGGGAAQSAGVPDRSSFYCSYRNKI